MFTGIVTDLGRLRDIERRQGHDARFVIETAFDTSTIAEGASIACSGCCLTLVDKGPGWFAADVSAETLGVTNLGVWQPGRPINLERALKVGDELGGHIVSGHVDGLAEAIEMHPENGSTRWRFRVPDALARYVAPKGSVALDGVSLTVNEVEGSIFGVNIIPHTTEKTAFSVLKVGEFVNFEIDMLARYVARLQGMPVGGTQ